MWQLGGKLPQGMSGVNLTHLFFVTGGCFAITQSCNKGGHKMGLKRKTSKGSSFAKIRRFLFKRRWFLIVVIRLIVFLNKIFGGGDGE